MSLPWVTRLIATVTATATLSAFTVMPAEASPRAADGERAANRAAAALATAVRKAATQSPATQSAAMQSPAAQSPAAQSPAAQSAAAQSPATQKAAAVAAKDYAAIVLADSPSVYYRLADAQGGAAADASGHNVAGTYTVAATNRVAGAIAGDASTAVRAADSRIVLEAPAASLPVAGTARTVEFWFKAAGASGTVPVVTYGGTRIELHDSGDVGINDNNAQARSFTLPHRTDDATWHLWDVTYDGTSVTFYLDGQALGTQVMPIGTNAGGNLQLGGWAGDYDELAVYPSALSAARVNARWTRGQAAATACAATPTAGYGSTVLADQPSVYYRFGDKSSRLAFDASGNCRNAALASYASAGPGAVTGDTAGSVAAQDTRVAVTAGAGALPSADEPRTVEFWFKAAGASGTVPVVTYGGTRIELHDSSDVGINDNSRQARSFALPHRTDDATWHLWDVTYDGANVTFYLDGQALGTQVMPIGTGTGGSLWLGGWAGDYDELAVFATALAPARIAAHWTAGASAAGACAATPATPYASAVLADKPVGYFRLGDVAKGRVLYDSSGNCRNAAATSYAFGVGGALAAQDDGALRAPDNRVALTASAAAFPSGAAPRTVEFWFKAAGASGTVPVLTYGGTRIELRDTDAVGINDNNSQARSFALPYRTDDAAWHLWDVTYDGTNVTFYLDGQSLGTQVMPIGTGTGGGLWLGGWAGDYDELAVYPAALSPARIGVHWTRGNSAVADVCAGVSASGYGATVVADKPRLYYRLGDLTTTPGSRVAFENAGNCGNAAYSTFAAKSAGGAVNGDTDGAVTAPDTRPVLRAPAATLPSGADPRTVEFWFKAAGASGTVPVLTYGGTRIELRDTDAVGINDNNAQARSFALPYRTDDKLWHLWDVTYDGTNVTFYLDGEALGTQIMPIGTGTGGSLVLGGWAGDYDELAVYPAALSGQRIAAHYTAGLVGSNAAISGTVTFEAAAVPGALVQACTAAGACAQGRTNHGGGYVLSVTPGSYDITVFPPATGNGAAARIGSAHADVPAKTSRITADLTLTRAVLPDGASIESPTVGTQTSGTPTIFWAEPTVYRTTGCPNGLGQLSVVMPNGGQRSYVMTEKPLGSGKYATVIPPLAPLHGDARVGTSILCRISATPFVPGGGPETGGNKIIVHVDSSSPAASFSFGSVKAPAFTTQAAGVYTVTVPAGTGDVPVSVTFGDGTARTLDTYHYLAATPISSGGPANGGGEIVLNGRGFTDQTTVMFGQRPAADVTVDSPTRLRVPVPSGSGSVPIYIIAGGGAVSGGSWTYTGTPTKVSGPDTGCPEPACTFASKLLGMAADYKEAGDLAGAPYDPKARQLLGGFDPIFELAGEMIPYALGLTESQKDALGWIGDAAAVSTLLGVSIGAPEVLLVVAVIGLAMWADNHREAFKHLFDGEFFHMLIDPSGTIVDRNGVPVPGATVTLLRRGEDGTYAPVPAGSDMIDPRVNPQTTPESGVFAWMAAAGSYRVRATSSTCLTTSGQPSTVEDGPYVLPPPAIGLILTLPCALPAAPAPTITGIQPSTITTGDTVTIYGTNLGAATAVTFAGKPTANFKILSPYAVTALAPAGSGHTVVRVTTSSGAAEGTVDYATAAVVPAPKLTVAASSSRSAAGRVVTVRATTSNLPATAVQVRIVEILGTTVRVAVTCPAVTGCSASVRHDPGAWRYQTQALDAAKRVVLSSSAVTVTWVKPALTIRTSSTAPKRGKKITLRATVSASTSGTPYRFVLRDLTTRKVIRTCGTVTTCTFAVANGRGAHRYEAEILTTRGVVLAHSSTVKVTWK